MAQPGGSLGWLPVGSDEAVLRTDIDDTNTDAFQTGEFVVGLALAVCCAIELPPSVAAHASFPKPHAPLPTVPHPLA